MCFCATKIKTIFGSPLQSLVWLHSKQEGMAILSAEDLQKWGRFNEPLVAMDDIYKAYISSTCFFLDSYQVKCEITLQWKNQLHSHGDNEACLINSLVVVFTS